jgi:Family of unknown function (DUF6077)
MKLRGQIVSESLVIGVALFGAWTLYAHVLIYFQSDFNVLKTFSLAPLLLAMLTFFAIRRRPTFLPPPARDNLVAKSAALQRIPVWVWFSCPFLIVGVLWFSNSEWVFWVLSTAYLFAATQAFSPKETCLQMENPTIGGREAALVAAICLIAALLTLGSNNPDPDDAFFMSLISATLDHPGAKLYTFDNLYRSGIPALEGAYHLLQTYEYFVAVLASVTGLSGHLLYYLVLPALWTVVGGLTQWLLLRRFLTAGPALIGLAGLVLLLAVWGDEHRAYGNFAFVRMYQGKAIYLFVALPMIVYSALRYRSDPTARNWIFLMLHQFAGVGFTVNGAVLGPLAAGMVLLAGMKWSRQSIRESVVGGAASFPVLLGAVWMKLNLINFYRIARESFQATGAVISNAQAAVASGVKPVVNDFYDIPSTVVLGYQTVLGLDRSNLALLGLLFLPLLASRANLRGLSWICNYLFVCSLFLLCPAASQLLGTYISHALSWRIFWSWPVPLLLALMVGAIASAGQLHLWIRAGSIAIILLIFTFAGPTAIQRDEWAWQNMGRYKVYPSHDAALHLMGRMDLTRPALIPEEMAISMVGLEGAPPLVAVRNYYLRNMGMTASKTDVQIRRALLSYIEERWINHIETDWVISQIERQGIASVAFRKTHTHAVELSAALVSKGFEAEESFGYVMATRRISVE